MLIVLVVVKVATKLLDIGIDAQLAGVDFLDSQIICLQFAIDVSLFLACVILNPNALHVRSSDNVVPLMIASSRMWLRRGEKAGFGHFLRKNHCNFIPHSSRFGSESGEHMFEGVKRFSPGFRSMKRLLKDLLLRSDSSCGSSDKERGHECFHIDAERS